MKIWSIVTVLESIMLTSNKLNLLSGPELLLLSLGSLNVEENWFVRITRFLHRRILFKLKFSFYYSNQIKLQIKYSS